LAGSDKIIAAVFASGSGSNAENILRFSQQHPDKISIPLVICNKEGAGVIGRCASLSVKCELAPVQREGYATFNEARRAQEQKVIALCEQHGVKWALLAGYMQIISPQFLKHFADPDLGINRVINIHPSLLPQFPGKDGYGDAWKAEVKQSGVTLHYVDEGVDTGPIIAQKIFQRLEGDTFEDFRARGMQLEYQVYTEFLKNLIGEEKKWAQR
jgi:phosphoribosylglycinamide formyltransferase-1